MFNNFHIYIYIIHKCETSMQSKYIIYTYIYEYIFVKKKNNKKDKFKL